MRYFERFLLVKVCEERCYCTYIYTIHEHTSTTYVCSKSVSCNVSLLSLSCSIQVTLPTLQEAKKAKENEKNRRICCRTNAERLVSETNQHYNKIQNISD